MRIVFAFFCLLLSATTIQAATVKPGRDYKIHISFDVVNAVSVEHDLGSGEVLSESSSLEYLRRIPLTLRTEEAYSFSFDGTKLRYEPDNPAHQVSMTYDFDTKVGSIGNSNCCVVYQISFNGSTGRYFGGDDDDPVALSESADLINVRVTISAVPLPAGLSLLAMGAGVFGVFAGMARKQKTSRAARRDRIRILKPGPLWRGTA